MDQEQVSEEEQALLHYGVLLLISNSKEESRVKARQDFETLLVCQAGMFLSGNFDEVLELGHRITQFLRYDEEQTNNEENVEIDMSAHGWVKGCLVPVKASHTETMVDVIPVNMDEAASTSDECLDECLTKKIAQLERALTYARYRVGKDDTEEVVGYEAQCNSMVDSCCLALPMIKLHPDIFPLLSGMLKKEGLAYLLSSPRLIVDHLQKAMESFGVLRKYAKTIKERVCVGLGISLGLSLASLGITLVSLFRSK